MRVEFTQLSKELVFDGTVTPIQFFITCQVVANNNYDVRADILRIQELDTSQDFIFADLGDDDRSAIAKRLGRIADLYREDAIKEWIDKSYTMRLNEVLQSVSFSNKQYEDIYEVTDEEKDD